MGVAPFYLRPFQPADQTACKTLILAGLEEHWGILDLTLNTDLNDIAATYAQGLFLTAWQDGQLAGTGALLPAGPGCFQVVRMSVAKHMRRQGLGQLILASLESGAKKLGAQRLVLETTTRWNEVVQFYLNSGYQISHAQDGDTYFVKALPSEPSKTPSRQLQDE